MKELGRMEVLSNIFQMEKQTFDEVVILFDEVIEYFQKLLFFRKSAYFGVGEAEV